MSNDPAPTSTLVFPTPGVTPDWAHPAMSPTAMLPKIIRYRLSDRLPFTREFKQEVAQLGHRTSQKNAARVYGVSCTTVRKWMIALGLPSRRTGAPLLSEYTDEYVSPLQAPVFVPMTYIRVNRSGWAAWRARRKNLALKS